MPTIRTAASKGAKLTPTEADADMKRTPVAKTTNYTLDATHNREIHELGGTIDTVTLPTVSSSFSETDDWRVTLKNTLSTAVTVSRNSQTIDGASSNYTLPTGESVTLAMNSTFDGFYIIERSPAMASLLGTGTLGQCQVTLDSTTVRLDPYKGNKLFINGSNETVPSAGVTIAGTGLTADTNYYVYAWMDGGTMTLDLSTTSHSTDTTYGHEYKTGFATHSLVGLVRTNSSGTIAVVRSWFNQVGSIRQTVADTSSGSSHSFVILPGAETVRLLFSNTSASSTASYRVRLGGSGGVETTGYYSGSSGIVSGAGTLYSNSGFDIYVNEAASQMNGEVVLTLVDPTTNLWSCTGMLGSGNNIRTVIIGGTKALSGELTTVELSLAAAGNYDNGTVRAVID